MLFLISNRYLDRLLLTINFPSGVVAMGKIKLLIADDHELFRAGLTRVLQSNSDIEVIGEAEDGLEAIRLTNKLQPNVVLMDLDMPVVNGFKATHIIMEENPNTQVIALSAYDDLESTVLAFSEGAKGFLDKNIAPRHLIKTIRSVASGKITISPSITADLIEHHRNTQTEPKKISKLSMRERDILALMVFGAE